MSRYLIVATCISSLLISACSTPQGPNEQGGMLLGAGGGALAGGLLGSAIGGGKGTLLGIGLGALAGGFAGNQIGKSMDQDQRARDEARYEAAYYDREYYGSQDPYYRY